MRQLTGLILLLFLLFVALPARAQEPPAGAITLQATPGFGGTVKYGEWLPVEIALENSGPSVTGRVQVRGTSASSMQRYAQQVELPTGARKRVMLYVTPSNFSRRLVVEFIPLDGEEALATGELALRPVPNIRYIVAHVGPEDGGLKPITSENFRGTSTNTEALLIAQPLESLPDLPEALRSLDLIILSGTNTTPLSSAQRAALEQFVAGGGVLALGGGASASQVLAGLPPSLQPVTLTGERELAQLPALTPLGRGEAVQVSGPFVAAVGAPVAGATVRVLEEGLPLVVERPVGQGAVLWMALDPALSPFNAWAGTGAFWQTLIGARARYPADLPTDVSPRQNLGDQLAYALQNLPSLDLPSLRLLIPLLALYIFAVGPMTYFLLRRRRRLELAWVVIPTLTILFSVGAYLLGFGLRGNDLIVNQISLVHVVPGGSGGTVQSMIGLFSPTRRSYTLEVSGGSPLLSPSASQSDPFGPAGAQPSGGGTPAIFLQGEPARVEGLSVNQWSMSSVMAEARLTEGYEMSGEASMSDGSLVGTLTNNGSLAWDGALIIMGAKYARLDPIPPGGSQPFKLPLPNENVVDMSFNDISWEIFNEDQDDRGMLPRQQQVRQQILSTLLNTATQSPALHSVRQPLVVAWVEAPPLRVVVDGMPIEESPATTALYGYLPTRFGTGEIAVPRGFLAGRFLSNDGSTCYSQGFLSLAPDYREAVVEFTLPQSLRGLQAKGGNLFILSDGGMVADLPSVALLDQSSQEWVPLPEVRRGRTPIPDIAPYLSPEGTVQFRFTSERSNQNGCLYFDMSLTGTLPAEGQP